jgi:integrase
MHYNYTKFEVILMRKHNWHPKIIENYLEKYYKNIDTRDTCRVYLKSFFKAIEIEPEDFIKLKTNQIQDLLFEFAKKVEEKPKKTQNAMLSIVKKFLIRKEIDVKEITWEDIRIRNNLIKGTRAITKKETPTANDLKKILSYATGIKSKCLFVFCASTGLRIDEALSLTFEDIDLNERKVTLVEKAKFEIPRVTFFTTEAKELLELWIPEREKMLQRKYKTSAFVRTQLEGQGYRVIKKDRAKKHYKENKYPFYKWHIYKDGKELSKEEIIALDDRIFPFDYVSAQRSWTNLLEKAGTPYNTRDYNPKLQYPRYLYNIHSLRRFYFTQLMFDRANEEYINYMGGHMSELDAAYKFDNKLMLKKLKEEYDTHMNCLMIFEREPDLSEHNERLTQLEKENEQLRKDLDRVLRSALINKMLEENK